MDALHTATLTNSPQPLLHQDAIVSVQRYDVGDRPKRHQVQKLRDQRRRPAQVTCERIEHIKGNAHARQCAARKTTAVKIGIHDDVGGR